MQKIDFWIPRWWVANGCYGNDNDHVRTWSVHITNISQIYFMFIKKIDFWIHLNLGLVSLSFVINFRDFQLWSHSSLNKRVFIQRDHRMLQLLLWYQAKDFELWQRPIINNFVTIWVDRHKRKRLKLWTVTLMKTYIVFAAKNQEIIALWFRIKI